MDALRLEADDGATWERFHAGREPTTAAEGALFLRWSRARGLGAAPDGPGPEERLVRGAELAVRAEPLAPLVHEGVTLLDRATGAAADRDFCLLLADATGVVTWSAGGGAFADEARRLRLIPGATWSEEARGTNAIGTALTEGRPTAVVGAAHFGRRFHDLVCYAAPVHDPDGRVVAVLDATSRRARADAAVSAVVSATAAALEALLRARRGAELGASASRLVALALDRSAGPALLVEAPGRVVRCNAAARVRLGPARLPRDAAQATGLSWSELCDEARAPTPGGRVVVTPHGAARLRVEALSDGGGVRGLVVFLDEERAARAALGTAARPDPFARVFAEDPATARAVAFARRVAPSDLPVVLLSETGSGKELFAAAFHDASHRSGGPFVPVNCGSLSPQLLESELFGYAGGAFTGADRSGREGLFHAASGGTLFLDEVAEMPPAMQTALLRVLEVGTYHRVGETAPRRADVRVICATCRDLPALVEAGTFRKDLYFRLKGVVVTLPPLRERTDRVALARHLAGGELTDALASWIGAYAWPGNVRELKSVLEVARVLAGPDEPLDVAHLPPDLAADPAPDDARLATVERRAVQRVLDELGGNVSAAARRLGVARTTVYRMLRRAE
jgi:transcriptional regulator of acetoin/glycerol metabolism